MSKKTHTDFLEIAETISSRLASTMEAVGPVRLTKRNDQPLSVVLCRAVSGQQVSAAAASTIWGRVVDQAQDGNLIEYIRSAPPETLRKAGLSGNKTKAMKSIAEAARDGTIDETTLKKLTAKERDERLTSIWGIGQWTADMMNIFFFGEKDIWPVGDVAVINTLERLTSKRRNHTKTASLFAPKRSYLALYMYKIVNSKAL